MAEHGLEGSQYGATVLSCLPDGHVYVEYDALNEDGMESDILLREWVAADLIIPPPPPAPTWVRQRPHDRFPCPISS